MLNLERVKRMRNTIGSFFYEIYKEVKGTAL
jgi:hypothetical protein